MHNSTEGFGIVAPLMSSVSDVPWLFLFRMGLVGGVPTIIGTIAGFFVVNNIMYVLLMSTAAGAILFVVLQLYGVGRTLKSDGSLAVGVFSGFAIALLTDLLVSAVV
ncbi:MAG: zinc permease, partial [Nitrososphaerota archaeon]|nr:zinc permease [Nitrososphaerota archaeon]